MSDGMNYAPTPRETRAACEPGEFRFGVIALDHGHIYGMTANLKEAGGTCVSVYDPDPKKLSLFCKQNPEVQVASDPAEILNNQAISLVASAAVPNLRAGLGFDVMLHDKDYFTDKTPFTSLEQLARARALVEETGRKYACCYSERLQNEAAEYAVQLVNDGVIGDVIQVLGLGPHRLNARARPPWFFNREQYGGIICDIGSHQAEQFLTYTGATDAEVAYARVNNSHNPDYPELEDFGEFNLVGNNGRSGYFRMDWFTPDGLRNWGDGRTVILGSEGYLELRKYVDIATPELTENNVYIVNGDGENRINVTGKIGFPFFPAFIRDCLDRTEHAMTQDHCFKAAELCLKAQALADRSR